VRDTERAQHLHRDIEAVNPNIRSGHVFICGPPLMIENLKTGLLARGVPPDSIHSESFDLRRGGYTAGSTGTRFQR
jgi:ferredoxin-NADP reductase